MPLSESRCHCSATYNCFLLTFLSAFCWEINAGSDPFLAVNISYCSLIYYKEMSLRFRIGKENSEINYTVGKIIQKEKLPVGISSLNGTR